MADETAGYAHLLNLAADWAGAGGIPQEVVLRRLCEWAVMGAFARGAFIDRFGDEISPLELLKDFKAAISGDEGVTLGGWTTFIQPGAAMNRLRQARVAVNDVRRFCDREAILPPPAWLRGIRRLWGTWRGRSLAPPSCPGVEDEAGRQESRCRAEIFLTGLRDQLKGLQDKPGYSLRWADGSRSVIKFNVAGPLWADTRQSLIHAIAGAGTSGDGFLTQLDELDAKWAALVQAKGHAESDFAWAWRVTESRHDWHKMMVSGRLSTDEEFQEEFFPGGGRTQEDCSLDTTQASKNQENSQQAVTGIETEVKKRRGRPKGSGSYVATDEPLVEEIHSAVLADPTLSPTAAAKRVAQHAAGAGTEDSKAQRLVARYSDKYGL